jgi:hypothetical protein
MRDVEEADSLPERCRYADRDDAEDDVFDADTFATTKMTRRRVTTDLFERSH